MQKLTVQFANSNELLVEICNELTVAEDGYAMIAPIGDHPGMALVEDGKGGFKKVRAIQRLDKAALTTMANEFEKASKGVKGYLYGCPIYVGHPDVPGYEKKYPDKAPKGVFSNVEVRESGLFGKPVFTAEGRELMEGKKFRALSGRWNAEPDGEDKGTPVFRPNILLSAGLTNQPNLPVQLLNEKDADVANEMDSAGKVNADATKAQDNETPEDRAEKASMAAHEASGVAAASSRKAKMKKSADMNLDAFHAHAAASEAHSKASASQKAAGYDDVAGDHSSYAESHQGVAMEHLKAVKKMGKEFKAEAANEKLIEAYLEKPEIVPITVVPRHELVGRNTTLANDLATASGKVTALETEKTSLTSAAQAKDIEIGNLKVARDQEHTHFANERDQHIKTICDYGIRVGKMRESDRADWERRLKVDGQFVNERRALENTVAQAVKTSSVTMERPGGRITLANAADKRTMQKRVISELATELKIEDNAANYDQLFRVGAQRNPELFGTTTHPIVKRQ